MVSFDDVGGHAEVTLRLADEFAEDEGCGVWVVPNERNQSHPRLTCGVSELVPGL
jgi:hypothetical protein